MTRYQLLGWIVTLLAALAVAGILNPASAAESARFEIRDEAGKVLIASDQIRSYDWTTHTLTLLPQVRGRLVEQLMKGHYLVSGISLTVAAGNDAIYAGTFTTNLSSHSFSTPVIVVDRCNLDPNLHEDQVKIQLGYPDAKFFVGKDPRADDRIRAVLAASGKLADTSDAHIAWVADSLQDMQTIKPGMTRADLLKVFKEEGGLSTRTSRRYTYRNCPFIKVDVKFDPLGNPKAARDESPDDRVTQISQPYLEWSIVD